MFKSMRICKHCQALQMHALMRPTSASNGCMGGQQKPVVGVWESPGISHALYVLPTLCRRPCQLRMHVRSGAQGEAAGAAGKAEFHNGAILHMRMMWHACAALRAGRSCRSGWRS